MILSISQYFKNKMPILKGKLFKFLYSSSNLKIGRNFQCDTFPDILINKKCKIKIGNNITFRRDVEIRAHGNSKIEFKNNIRVDRGVRILATNDSTIVINDNTRIGLYSVLNGGDSITIGKKVLISGFVYLQTSMHNHMKKNDVQEQGFSHAKIVLKDDVWLGAHTVVLPGITIGRGAIVGSNAVVTRSILEFNIAGGVPAKIIKERK